LVSPQPYQLSRRLEKARPARAGTQVQTAFAYRTKRGVDWLDARGKIPLRGGSVTVIVFAVVPAGAQRRAALPAKRS
jgi:hypothetical protein